MPKYVIKHGSVRTPEGHIGPDASIELPEDEAKRMDPTGLSIVPEGSAAAKKPAAPKTTPPPAEAKVEKFEKPVPSSHGKGR